MRRTPYQSLLQPRSTGIGIDISQITKLYRKGEAHLSVFTIRAGSASLDISTLYRTSCHDSTFQSDTGPLARYIWTKAFSASRCLEATRYPLLEPLHCVHADAIAEPFPLPVDPKEAFKFAKVRHIPFFDPDSEQRSMHSTKSDLVAAAGFEHPPAPLHLGTYMSSRFVPYDVAAPIHSNGLTIASSPPSLPTSGRALATALPTFVGCSSGSTGTTQECETRSSRDYKPGIGMWYGS